MRGPGAQPRHTERRGTARRRHRQSDQAGGRAVSGPVYEFAPAIDEYLKTHLFGAIFERDNLDWQSRELATVGMLSALPGAEAQLQSHMRVSMNVGLTASQLRQLTEYWPTVWAPRMPDARARRWSGNWPPHREDDVSAAAEHRPPAVQARARMFVSRVIRFLVTEPCQQNACRLLDPAHHPADFEALEGYPSRSMRRLFTGSYESVRSACPKLAHSMRRSRASAAARSM